MIAIAACLAVSAVVLFIAATLPPVPPRQRVRRPPHFHTSEARNRPRGVEAPGATASRR